MRILVFGSGGREHVLAWKLAQTEYTQVFLAPGNPGITLETNVVCTGISDHDAVADFCERERIQFVVVGPDQALADGIVDLLEKRGIPTFGPTAAAAKIESSKIFSKELMKTAGIPTARFETFADFAAAKKFLTNVDWGDGWVIKADGLALGKGVVVCETRDDALKAAEDFLVRADMGDAGKRIVIEERLLGRETSAFFLCDGENATPLGFACDYKRIFNGDKGPNTGGMGAYSPVEWLPADTEVRVRDEIVLPLLREMKKNNAPYKGVLFVGLMVGAVGPKVIEFNARFGDPETQALLPLIDEDLLPWFQACREGKLQERCATGPKKKDLHAVHVVMAAAGYPGTGGQTVQKGDRIEIPIELLPKEGDGERLAKLFFAGVARKGADLVTNGGRVLGLTALASTREEARRKAYAILETVKFKGAQRRSDVGS